MPNLSAKNVSLLFPVHSHPQLSGQGDAGGDARFVVSLSGRVQGVRALDQVSFDLKSGDRLALIGANGSGKTTLLQLMAGILTPDEGEIVVEGRTTNLININFGLRMDATGYRNIVLRGLAVGQTIEAIEERRADIEKFSELNEFLNLPVSAYSAGMRMRLSFAIATAFEPEILLLDEWLSVGDEAFRKKASQRMLEFVDKAGILVLASHNDVLLRQHCNRALWLDRGRVRMDGGVDEVLSEYDASDVAAE